ncbi:hypothetical protein VKI21_12515 [Cyanobacterium aponinum UTEX 3222]|uniref:hypothetical protein n=1 Tax=Cyanobacterium aponinum TaxID=379064 RepID=UPI00308925D0|nr:hypothetical protein VKI21_12515 [Cyanobacterium aponinum UTEX 3222]
MLHPLFNKAKGHHSDVEFKPSLAYFNYEQTYDVLAISRAGNLGFQDLGLSGNYRNIVNDFLNGNIIKFDRYFPENGIFAVDYSGKFYYSLKKFSQGFSNIPFMAQLINGSRDNETPIPSPTKWADIFDYSLKPVRSDFVEKYRINYDEIINEKYSNEDYQDIDLTTLLPLFPPHEEELIFTFAVYNHHNSTVNYKTTKIKPSTITKNLNILSHYTIVPCSGIIYKKRQNIYVEETILDDYFDSISQSFLYKNVDSFLDDLVSELDYILPNHNKGLQVDLTLYCETELTITNTTFLGGFVFNGDHIYKTSSFTPQLLELPDWYRKSIYRVANNNYWKNTNQDTDAEDDGEDFLFFLDEFNDLIPTFYKKYVEMFDKLFDFSKIDNIYPSRAKVFYSTLFHDFYFQGDDNNFYDLYSYYANGYIPYWNNIINYFLMMIVYAIEPEITIRIFYVERDNNSIEYETFNEINAIGNPVEVNRIVDYDYSFIELFSDNYPNTDRDTKNYTSPSMGVTFKTFHDEEPTKFIDESIYYFSDVEIMNFLQTKYENVEGYV